MPAAGTGARSRVVRGDTMGPKGGAAGVDIWGPTRTGQQGCRRAVAPRGGHTLLGLLGRTGRKAHLLLLVPSLQPDSVEGKVRSPEKRAEMAHLGTGNWPFRRVAI